VARYLIADAETESSRTKKPDFSTF